MRRAAAALCAILVGLTVSCGSPVNNQAIPATTTPAQTPTPSPSETPTNPSPDPTPSVIGTIVAVRDNFFEPVTLTIPVGGTITWYWGGVAGGTTAETHNVVADDGRFTSGGLSSSGALTVTFDGAGSFRYHCEHHGGAGGAGMSGVVNVA